MEQVLSCAADAQAARLAPTKQLDQLEVPAQVILLWCPALLLPGWPIAASLSMCCVCTG